MGDVGERREEIEQRPGDDHVVIDADKAVDNQLTEPDTCIQTTRGNNYKLQKCVCHYNLRKYPFCSRVVNVWNSLPNNVVEADTINIFKNRLDKHWLNQEVLFNFK